MRRLPQRTMTLAALVLCAPLVLSSPSVGSDAVSGTASPGDPALACETGSVPPAAPAQRLEAAKRAAAARRDAGPEVILLNGRGYNYFGGQEQVEQERIRRELERQRESR